MLVNDKNENRYQRMSPQFSALRLQAKQACEGKASACDAKPFIIRSRGSRILCESLTHKDTHYLLSNEERI